MTEDEAKTKWCPFARHMSHPFEPSDDKVMVLVTSNREPGTLQPANDPTTVMMNCVGSECMAWRWSSDLQVSGFCGLAGKP